MTLLSEAQKASIRASIKLVTDTFFDTTVAYELKGDSNERWNEDRADQESATYNLKALVEWSTLKSAEELETEQGAQERGDVKVTLHFADLRAFPALVDEANEGVTMNSAKDYMTIKGERYRVTYVGYDGPLESENVLVIVRGVKEEKYI